MTLEEAKQLKVGDRVLAEIFEIRGLGVAMTVTEVHPFVRKPGLRLKLHNPARRRTAVVRDSWDRIHPYTKEKQDNES